MRTTHARTAAVAAITGLMLLGTAACGSDDAEPAATPSASAAPTEEATTEAPASSGDLPSWANPVSTEGEKIASGKVGDLSVDVYQVGTEKATKTGQFVNPDDNKPIIAEGDEIVFVNYVVTNTGDDIDLGSSFLNVDGRYDDWPYMQGMDGIVDDSLYEKLGVSDGALKVGEFADPSIYTLAKGQSFAFAENFKYQKGSPIVFKMTATPVDETGDLLSDQREEAEVKGTIS